MATRDCRLFDIQHAVLPTHLPLEQFYEELVKTQQTLNKKFLGFTALRKTAGLVSRKLMPVYGCCRNIIAFCHGKEPSSKGSLVHLCFIGRVMFSFVRILMILILLENAGCVGTIIGTASDIVIETVKIPFKVGAAIVDAANNDDNEEKKD